MHSLLKMPEVFFVFFLIEIDKFLLKFMKKSEGHRKPFAGGMLKKKKNVSISLSDFNPYD